MKPSSLALCALLTAAPAASGTDYSGAIQALEGIVREEMRDWNIGGLAVALVDDQRVVYAGGFGEAKRDSVFRVGSISKLFNALAVMQQVEAGKLDLDAPLPSDLLPVNPFPGAPPVTLRQMLCHRSGLPRESPVGGYFDDAQPGLAATVASLRSCVLATRPGEKTRYSNIAPSLAGCLLQRAVNQPFEDYVRQHLLEPLQMTNSAWTLARTSRDHLVPAHIRVADGQGGWTRRAAPLFDLGELPAGNLFASAEDLARFACALLAGGAGLVKPETLREMWRPQLTSDQVGFGLGFMLGKFREHRTIGHNGAVYGHSTSLILLPEAKLGVIVLGNEDLVNGRIRRINDAALSLLLEARFGEKPPLPPPSAPPENLTPFTGHYESQSFWASLELREGRLAGEISGQPTRFAPAGDLNFTIQSRLESATPVVFERDEAGAIRGFKLGIQHFMRVPANPPPLPPEWRAFLGGYGPDIIPVVVSERHGHLYAMTENMLDYRLTPLNRRVCALPPGLYTDEQVVFLTGRDGRAHSLDFANMILPRRKQP